MAKKENIGIILFFLKYPENIGSYSFFSISYDWVWPTAFWGWC